LSRLFERRGIRLDLCAALRTAQSDVKKDHAPIKTKSLTAVLACWAVVVLLSGVLSGSAAHAEPAETVTLTLPNMPLHDPWILANDSDKTYYLYTSNLPSMSGVQGAGDHLEVVRERTDLDAP